MMIRQVGQFGVILIMTLIATIQGQLSSFCQEVETKSVRILINNLPDTTPPSVKLMTPYMTRDMIYETEVEEMDIIGEVKDESGVKFISVNTELRPVNEAGLFSSRLKLLQGENEIRLVASDNRDNIVEKVYIVAYNPVVTLEDRIKKEAKYYGLIIGIDNYIDDKLPDLDNPINDAEKMYHTLTAHYNFSRNNMILLRDAKRNDIVYALDSLANKVGPTDNVLIFYAGHGKWDEKANVGYWLPSDASYNTRANWFRNSTLVDYLKTIDSKHTLLITDACFAGSIFKTRAGFTSQDRAFEVLYELPSRKAMTSGHLTEVPDRSSFTRYLIERLNENQKTYLSSEQLFSSFRIAVINNSDAIPQYGEIRNVGDEGGDFIFLKKK